MVRGKRDGLLIAGGGLAGCLAAIALAKARPEVSILLVQEGESFGGDRGWTFFDGDLTDAERQLAEPLVAHHWQGHYVAFPGHSRKLKAGLNLIRSEDLDRAVRETLRPDQYRLGTRIVAVRDNELVLLGGEKIRADGAIDARGAANLSMIELGWRWFGARDYRFAAPHGLDRPVLIDATVDQADGCRFVSCLPLDAVRMTVADHRYTESPDAGLADPALGLDAYVAKRGWRPAEILGERSGSLPVALAGDFGAFWRVGGARVAKLGLRGGFFHPTTGATAPDAIRNAALLAHQRHFEGAALHDLFEAQAVASWKKRELYRTFNTALLRSSPPAERYRAFEQLYRLDPEVIARFHAARPTVLDRMRILGAATAKAAQRKR